ncbi:hypothetical protein P152DRAFT_379375, partial [Eremomyces bilateralis CBS 781.70]
DSLICQWVGCGERCSTAEQLYDHVCERHVGRKSTNNLNLTCQWGTCKTTTVKRDHITSHIRVHVPLKPHKCDFCGKAFKRPQDLKKHVKTHADDSVLHNSPPASNRGGHGQPGGYGSNSKHFTDLRAIATTANGYHGDYAAAGGYPYSGGPASAYHAASQGYPAGAVYYPVHPQSNQMESDYHVRKKATFDALKEFFGDVQNRKIDPSTYYDVGQRLMNAGVALPLMQSFHGGAGGDYHGGGVATAAYAQPPHMLPLPGLRKTDLSDIDRFLEQLQNTVYSDNPSHAAAAGVAQPGAHYVHTGVGYRSSNSPPNLAAGAAAAAAAATHGSTLAPLASSVSTETPALTPASSVMSYASTQSPVARTSAGPHGYPPLPPVTGMSEMGGSYTSSAPSSSLATSFDPDGRRRFSGGILQKAATPFHDVKMDSDDAPTPRGSSKTASVSSDLPRDVNRLRLVSPSLTNNIDPSLSSPAERSDGSDDTEHRWVDNVRYIEELRKIIKYKLEHEEYEAGGIASLNDEHSVSEYPYHIPKLDESKEDEQDAENLYPILRAVRD